MCTLAVGYTHTHVYIYIYIYVRIACLNFGLFIQWVGSRVAWINEWTNTWKTKWMMDRWKDGRMEGWKDGRMDRWMDGWMGFCHMLGQNFKNCRAICWQMINDITFTSLVANDKISYIYIYIHIHLIELSIYIYIYKDNAHNLDLNKQ